MRIIIRNNDKIICNNRVVESQFHDFFCNNEVIMINNDKIIRNNNK